MLLHFQTYNLNDFDKVIGFMLEKDIPIKSWEKPTMTITAELSTDLANKMLEETSFDGIVTFSNTLPAH